MSTGLGERFKRRQSWETIREWTTEMGSWFCQDLDSRVVCSEESMPKRERRYWPSSWSFDMFKLQP